MPKAGTFNPDPTKAVGPSTPTQRPSLGDLRKMIGEGKSSAGTLPASVGRAATPGTAKVTPPGVDKVRLPADLAKAKKPDTSSGLPKIDKARLPGDLPKVKFPGDLPKATGLGKGGEGTKTLPSAIRVKQPSIPELGTAKGISAGAAKVGFAERVQKGQLDPLTKGNVAQQIRLSEQYRAALQGDVARRLQLTNNVTNVTNVNNINITRINRVTNVNNIFNAHPHYAYRGWVSPYYQTQAFHFHHHLPYFSTGFCWYPRWSPWVNWSWHYRCLPFWDPRPYWCRPVVYVVATPWVYWTTPTWVALPSVPCGTWVEVQKVVILEEQYDVQLLAVRFVDPGHPDQKLGPRYRIWFRNNSGKAVTTPFNVQLLASGDGQLHQNLPQAGARIASIGAGETQSVDVRLPPEVNAMTKDAKGQPGAFTTLHVLVDANREVSDANRANNGAKIAAGEILPVDPVAFEVDPTTVPAGGEVILAGEGLGPEPGKVLVHLGGLEMEAEIVGWYDLGVRLKAPSLPLASPTKAELIVVRGDGAAANPVTITVDPPALGGAAAESGPPAAVLPSPPKPEVILPPALPK